MALAPLSRLNDWELEHSDQDLRGHYLKDYDGNRLGRIDEMIVDTDAERVTAIRLEDGTEYPVQSLELRGDDAYLLRDAYAGTATAGTATAGTATATKATLDRDIIDRDVDRTQARSDMGTTERAIPIVEERLRILKRSSQVGEVEVHTRAVEEQKTVDVPVMHEEVYVERRDVAERPADAPVLAEGETIRVPVMGEEAQVEKEAVVTGEVVVGKRQVVENEHVSGTVRRTEVDVEREGDAHLRSDADRKRPLDRDRI